MRTEKAARLKKLRPTFDIFHDSPEPPEETVRNGLVPPLPVRGQELIWGHAILRKAEELGCGELFTMPLEVSKEEALYLALTLEGRCDRYSWREKEAILTCMRSEDETVEPKPELLSLVQSEGSFIHLTERFTAFPEHIKSIVERGVIDLRTAEIVEFLDPDVISKLERVSSNGSFSQRRQIFTWVYEIIMREGLSSDWAAEMLDEMAGKGFAEAVRKRRFPTVASLEQAVEDFRSRYTQGTGIDLRPPPQFEGDAYTVRFEWKTGKQMERIIEQLRAMNENRNELFRLLF